MRVAQRLWTERGGWGSPTGAALNGDSSLIFYFGAPQAIADGRSIRELSKLYPSAKLIGCSTGGEIHGEDVLDDSVSATVIGFDHTRVATAEVSFNEWANAYDAGRALARKLIAPGLRSVFVLSDGIHVNGSELVRGMSSVLRSARADNRRTRRRRRALRIDAVSAPTVRRDRHRCRRRLLRRSAAHRLGSPAAGTRSARGA